MPILYYYLGIKIFFWSNEHKPIHVHAQYGNAEIKVSFFLKDGKVVRTTYNKTKGAFPAAKEKELKKFISKNKMEIVQKWCDFFILDKDFKPKKITKRI